jgi:hypothetical protein
MSAFIVIHNKGGNIGMPPLHLYVFVEQREAGLLARLTTKQNLCQLQDGVQDE